MALSAQAHACRRGPAAALTLASMLMLSSAVYAAPPIRTGPDNRVPKCVSPERLMAFLRDRNGELDPRFGDIARWYKHYGDAWGVRWDYAFYQMVLETNYLKYRRGNGRRGDVHEKQNNFAGIGATGGGVPGERFADVKTGVHAQIQHLVAYSGERVTQPVAKRTAENQDDIIAKSRRLGRPVTFGDLARRWAVDRQYAKNIDAVSGMFTEGYCKGPVNTEEAALAPPPAPRPAKRFAKPSMLGGPKPNMLAGPQTETLPWQTGEAVSQANTQPQPSEKAPPDDAPRKSGPPVRTLWSRDKATKPEVRETPAPAADAMPQDARAQMAAPAVSEQAQPAGSFATEPAPAASTASTDAEEPITLPTFRIAPAMPEPSRLGGPVDPADVAPAAARMPPGTFVESDPPPVTASPSIAQKIAAAAPAAGAGLTHASRHALDGKPRPLAKGSDCRILAASYGGQKTLLVQSSKDGLLQLTALTVLDGFESSMFASYAKAHAPGAQVIAEFKTKADAVTEAKVICPRG